MTETGAMSPIADRPDATPRGWYFLALLTFVTLYGVIDRRVFVLLADPIKAEMMLTDAQLGLLQGLGIALLGIIVTYPLGWLADRYDRRYVLAGCITAWSLAVVWCAFAGGFGELLIASAMVGAGEAGLAPIAYALIPLFFHNNKRQLANSIYVVGGLLGAGPAVALCGYLIELADWLRPNLPLALQALSTWRLTFLIAALPAPLFVVLVLLLRLPKNNRVSTSSEAVGGEPGSIDSGKIGLIQFFRQNLQTCATFFVSVSIVLIAVISVVTWWPVAAMRQFKATPIEVGNMQGIAFAVSGVVAMAATEVLMRLLRPRYGIITPLIIVWISFVGVAISLLLSTLAPSAAMLFLIFGFFSVFATSGSMAFPTVVQELGPAHLRGRMAGLYAVFGFIGVAIGPLAVGILSDQMGGQQDSLIKATAIVGTVATVIGSVLLLFCFRSYPKTFAAARALDARA